jgi:hypothetical protein
MTLDLICKCLCTRLTLCKVNLKLMLECFKCHISKATLLVKLNFSLHITKYYAMKMYWGSRSTAPCILNVGTKWRWAVSFMPQLLHCWGKSLWYPFDRRLGGPLSWSGCGCEEEEIPSLYLPGNEPQLSSTNVVTMLTEISSLLSI